MVIDDNPGRWRRTWTYGPRGDPSLLALRVRVNQYTYMHAVAETSDGALHETAQFVKAAGGCSAPVGAGEADSLAEIGRMKLRLCGEVAAGKPVEAQLLIRHPNFNGMQMDQLTRLYTPMKIVQQVEITLNGERVLSLESDISLATDPAIGFRFVPHARTCPASSRSPCATATTRCSSKASTCRRAGAETVIERARTLPIPSPEAGEG